MLTELFSRVLTMSLSGSAVIVTILLLRLVLIRGPKWCVSLLWIAMLFRLLSPVAIESPVSGSPVMDTAEQTVSQWKEVILEDTVTLYSHTDAYARGIAAGWEPRVHQASGAHYLLADRDGQKPDTAGDRLFPLFAGIWLTGMLCLLLWNGGQYLRLRRKLTGVLRQPEGNFLSDQIDAPFVLGLLVPRIYLPAGLSEGEQKLVLAHERCHIRWLDPWTKLLLLIALCIHWFNPLVWIGYRFAVQDMEMRCDESAIRKLGTQFRPDYAGVLLRLSSGAGRTAASAAGFGSDVVRNRILRVIRWEPCSRFRSFVCCLVCAASLPMMVMDPADPAPIRWAAAIVPEETQIQAWPYHQTLHENLYLRDKQEERLLTLLKTLSPEEIRVDQGEPLIPYGGLRFRCEDMEYYLFLNFGRKDGLPVVQMARQGDPETMYILDDLLLETYVEHIFDHFICTEWHKLEMPPDLMQVTSFDLDSHTRIYVFQYYCDQCGTYSKKYVETSLKADRFRLNTRSD